MKPSRLRLAAALALLTTAAAASADDSDPEARLAAAIERKDAAAALAAARAALGAREAAHERDPRGLAASLDELAGRLAALGAAQAAPFVQSLYERSLSLQEGVVGARALALVPTLDKLSELHYDQGHWEACEAIDRRVLELRLAEQGEDHADVVQARRNLAADLYRQGRFAEQERLLLSAVASLEKAAARTAGALGDALAELAESMRAQARYAEAEPLFVRALDVGASQRSTVLSNLAGLFRDQNRYAESLWRLSQAVEAEEARPKPSQARLVRLWNNMAEVYRFQGDAREAERCYSKAVDGARAVFGPAHPSLGTALNQLAELYRETGRLALAEPLYRESLAIKTAALGPGHPDVAHTEEGLGRLFAASGRPAEGEEAVRSALRIRESRLGADHPDVGETKVVLAQVLAAQPEKQAEARAVLDAAIAILGATTADPRSLARALSARASAKRAEGDRAGARADLERALLLVEALRPQAGGGEQTRARFGSSFSADFARLAGWLADDGDVDGGFRTAERYRARAFLDQLDAAHALMEGIEPEERRRFARREADVLSRLSADRDGLRVLDAAASTPGAERALLAGRVAAAEREYQRLYEDVRNASRLWRGFVSPREPLGVAAAQRQAVPAGSILLSYLVDDSQALLFVVAASGAAAAHRLEVPPAAAGVLGVAPGPLSGGALRRILAPESVDPAAADGLLARLGRPPMAGRARPALHRQLHALFDVLVPQPVWRQLSSSGHAILLPDHLLHRLPFEALVVELGQDATRFWLDTGPPIRYAPSATTLAALADRPIRAATRGLVSVADPDYGARTVDALAADAAANAGGAARGLARLPGTAREAAAIRRSFAGQGPSEPVTSIEGREAREPRVRAAIPGARYLHFATHGLVDDAGAELFANLALAPPASPPQPTDDGLLQMHEIVGLRLDADLAVLSACESRIGPILAGEGVFALSRAFLVAGSRRVVASLWPVEDASTADLFGGMFAAVARADAEGVPVDYPAALAQAKLELRGRPSTADPFFWAPFVIEGSR